MYAVIQFLLFTAIETKTSYIFYQPDNQVLLYFLQEIYEYSSRIRNFL